MLRGCWAAQSMHSRCYLPQRAASALTWDNVHCLALCGAGLPGTCHWFSRTCLSPEMYDSIAVVFTARLNALLLVGSEASDVRVSPLLVCVGNACTLNQCCCLRMSMGQQIDFAFFPDSFWDAGKLVCFRHRLPHRCSLQFQFKATLCVPATSSRKMNENI